MKLMSPFFFDSTAASMFVDDFDGRDGKFTASNDKVGWRMGGR